jgi:hypothetical protein
MAKTSLDRFMAPPKDKVSLEDAMVHWAIDTRQPFTAVEQLLFRKMFDSAGINVPIKQQILSATGSRTSITGTRIP